MFHFKNRKSFAAAVLALTAGCIVFSSSAAVSAETSGCTAGTSCAATQSQKPDGEKKGPFKGGMPGLDSAVTDKIITQAEADSISAYLKDNRPARGTDVFSALVTAKILTQDKADALKAYLKTKGEAMMKERLTKALDKFVSDSTITQAQADKILAALIAAKPEKKADGTKPQFVNPLTALIKDGTITQAQADKISPAIRFGGHPGGRHQGMGNCGKAKRNNNCSSAA